jgi:hypothetical protein
MNLWMIVDFLLGEMFAFDLYYGLKSKLRMSLLLSILIIIYIVNRSVIFAY